MSAHGPENDPTRAFIDALWQAADAVQQVRDEHGQLPDTAIVLTPQDAHRLRVGCLGLAEALREALSVLVRAEERS